MSFIAFYPRPGPQSTFSCHVSLVLNDLSAFFVFHSTDILEQYRPALFLIEYSTIWVCLRFLRISFRFPTPDWIPAVSSQVWHQEHVDIHLPFTSNVILTPWSWCLDSPLCGYYISLGTIKQSVRGIETMQIVRSSSNFLLSISVSIGNSHLN